MSLSEKTRLLTLVLKIDTHCLRVYIGITYGKINFDFFDKFLLPDFLFEPTALSANTFQLALFQLKVIIDYQMKQS